jgi:GTP pyrophosphokinase
MNVNIHKLTIRAEDGVFDGSIELRVHDRDDVKIIMDELKKIEGIQEITQIM